MANPHHYSKLFLGAFDGHSPDMKALTVAQRYVWFAVLAFARAHEPFGVLNTGIENDAPIPASLRRLASWADVSVSTMSTALNHFEKRGMLKRDGRRSNPCWQIANWEKWQVSHGLGECSGDEQEGVREPNTPEEECSGNGQQRSGNGQQRPADGHQCPSPEHLSEDDECSGGEHSAPESEGAQRPRAEAYSLGGCSGGERPIEVKSNYSGVEDGHPALSDISEDDNLISRCMKVLEPITGAASSPAAAATINNVLGIAGAEEVLYECCVALAAKKADGKRAELSWLVNDVSDALRRQKKFAVEDAPPPTDTGPDPADFSWLDNRTPEQQARIDADAQRAFDKDMAFLKAVK